MAFVRWMLALLVIAYGLFNSIAPVSTLLYKVQNDWPAGWAALQRTLSFPNFSMGGAGTNRFQPLMQATNWLQVAMWLTANLLYLLCAARLMGSRPRGAFSLFGVAFLLDVATWFTFKRLTVYDLTFSAYEQQQGYLIFAILAGVGGLVWLLGRKTRRPRLQPILLIE